MTPATAAQPSSERRSSRTTSEPPRLEIGDITPTLAEWDQLQKTAQGGDRAAQKEIDQAKSILKRELQCYFANAQVTNSPVTDVIIRTKKGTAFEYLPNGKAVFQVDVVAGSETIPVLLELNPMARTGSLCPTPTAAAPSPSTRSQDEETTQQRLAEIRKRAAKGKPRGEGQDSSGSPAQHPAPPPPKPRPQTPAGGTPDVGQERKALDEAVARAKKLAQNIGNAGGIIDRAYGNSNGSRQDAENQKKAAERALEEARTAQGANNLDEVKKAEKTAREALQKAEQALSRIKQQGTDAGNANIRIDQDLSALETKVTEINKFITQAKQTKKIEDQKLEEAKKEADGALAKAKQLKGNAESKMKTASGETFSLRDDRVANEAIASIRPIVPAIESIRRTLETPGTPPPAGQELKELEASLAKLEAAKDGVILLDDDRADSYKRSFAAKRKAQDQLPLANQALTDIQAATTLTEAQEAERKAQSALQQAKDAKTAINNEEIIINGIKTALQQKMGEVNRLHQQVQDMVVQAAGKVDATKLAEIKGKATQARSDAEFRTTGDTSFPQLHGQDADTAITNLDAVVKQVESIRNTKFGSPDAITQIQQAAKDVDTKLAEVRTLRQTMGRTRTTSDTSLGKVQTNKTSAETAATEAEAANTKGDLARAILEETNAKAAQTEAKAAQSEIGKQEIEFKRMKGELPAKITEMETLVQRVRDLVAHARQSGIQSQTPELDKALAKSNQALTVAKTLHDEASRIEPDNGESFTIKHPREAVAAIRAIDNAVQRAEAARKTLVTKTGVPYTQVKPTIEVLGRLIQEDMKAGGAKATDAAAQLETLKTWVKLELKLPLNAEIKISFKYSTDPADDRSGYFGAERLGPVSLGPLSSLRLEGTVVHRGNPAQADNREWKLNLNSKTEGKVTSATIGGQPVS